MLCSSCIIGSLNALHIASRDGDFEQCQLLIAGKADVNDAEGCSAAPLRWAASRGRVEVCHLLIACNADVNATQRCSSVFKICH